MPKSRKELGKWDEGRTKGIVKETKPLQSTRKQASLANASTDLADVKLDDFANSSKACSRVRKVAVRKAIDQAAATLEGSGTPVLEDGEVNEEEVPLVKTHKPKNKKHVEELDNDQVFIYPLEFWFLIGRFVKPEDVLLFALICRSSHYVTKTFDFWKQMYKRHYDVNADLPLRLQPECILRPWCLRACVVRALFQMYPPFKQRLLNKTLSTDDLSSLIPHKCMYMFPLQTKGKWQFIFKFQTDTSARRQVFATRLRLKKSSMVSFDDFANSDDIVDITEDVMANPEEGSRVLSVTSSHFILVPPSVMGCYLVEAKSLLSRDLLRQRLRLVFTASPHYSRHGRARGIVAGIVSGGSGEVVEFDSVETFQVLPWWYPSYPVPHDFR